MGTELRQSSLRLAKCLLKTASGRHSMWANVEARAKMVVLQHSSEQSCGEK
ncbi:hypothetical protein [Bradyrhizobium forestalis]|uniref:hypothetical protein n=1 Tax=Bradyrhizobium forestalis TaxID=1419263 RepID=UPI001303FB78|nr:hypothetical protein [Bradyrhizobium forestalis]